MRIAIVAGDALMREALGAAIALGPDHTCTWTASAAGEALAQVTGDLPDLLLLALPAARVELIELVRQVTARTSCPILVVAANGEAEDDAVIEAMAAGAFDAVRLPVPGAPDWTAKAAPLIAKIGAIAALARANKTAGGMTGPGRRRAPGIANALVAVGASAGGPAALAALLSSLPKDFPAAIVIVQHVDERFAPAMVSWLAHQSSLPVRLAAEDDLPEAATVLLAGSSDHLYVKASERLGYTPEPRATAYRPSVDVLFRSIARHWRGAAVGVLLTGMGSDGAAGLKELRSEGHHTIAQDKASSAVYGMPKAAVALDAAVDVLPLRRIPSRLVSLVAPSLRRRATR